MATPSTTSATTANQPPTTSAQLTSSTRATTTLTTAVSTPTMASTSAAAAAGASTAAAAVTETTVRPSAKPPTFKFNGNVDTFLARLDVYFRLYPSLTDEAKIATLQAQLDDSSFQVFQHKLIPPTDRQNYARFITHVRERLGPRENEQELRLNFRDERQLPNQPFDDFYEKLVRLSIRAFPGQPADVVDNHIRDQLIQGCHNSNTQLKLIEAAPADSQHALALANRFSAAHTYAKRISVNEQHSQSRSSAIRGRTRQFQRSSSIASRTSDGRPICFNCQIPGHIAAHCRRPTSTHFNSGRGRPSFNRDNRPPFQPDRHHQFSRNTASSPSPSSPRRSSALRETSPLRDQPSSRHSPEPPRYDLPPRGRGNSSHFRGRRPVSVIYSSEDDHNALGMKGFINDLPINFFVDSGSTISLISHATWEKLQHQSDKSLQNCTVNASSVTDEPLEILGRVSLEIVLSHSTNKDAVSQYTHEFYVAKEIAYECLLGLDFLRMYGAKIDIEDCSILLQDADGISVVYKMFALPDYSKTFNVYACSDTVVQPRAEVLLTARLSHRPGMGMSSHDGKENILNNVTGMFVPAVNLAEKCRLVGASIIATVFSDQICVRVLNAHADPISLKSNVLLGSFQLLTDEEIERPYEDDFRDCRITVNNDYEMYESRANKYDSWDEEGPSSPQHSQSRAHAASANCALVSSIDVNAYKLKTDKELLAEIDVGEHNTPADEKALCVDMIGKHLNVFARSKRDLGRVKMVQFSIDTGDAPPIRAGLRRMSPPQREIVETQIVEMLEDGIIEPSYGPWSSPIVLVRKKNGDMRFCIDYRKLNAVTLPDCYPMPLILDALDSLGGAKYFSTLDCQSGYWQIEVDPKDRDKTTFTSHYGMFNFTVLPFGVTNAPAFFQRTMDCILSGLNWKKCLIYIDDVIVFGKTLAEHNNNLMEVFKRFEDAGLKLNLKKCHFFKDAS
jgi:hypothetical protein